MCRIQMEEIERKAEEKLFTRHKILNIEEMKLERIHSTYGKETKTGRRKEPWRKHTAARSFNLCTPKQ